MPFLDTNGNDWMHWCCSFLASNWQDSASSLRSEPPVLQPGNDHCLSNTVHHQCSRHPKPWCFIHLRQIQSESSTSPHLTNLIVLYQVTAHVKIQFQPSTLPKSIFRLISSPYILLRDTVRASNSVKVQQLDSPSLESLHAAVRATAFVKQLASCRAPAHRDIQSIRPVESSNLNRLNISNFPTRPPVSSTDRTCASLSRGGDTIEEGTQSTRGHNRRGTCSSKMAASQNWRFQCGRVTFEAGCSMSEPS